MTYPEAHNYLTIHWAMTTSNERGQIGLRYASATPPTQQAVDNAAAAVQQAWTGATTALSNTFRLDFLRAARVDVDGRYPPGSVSIDHVYAAGVVGAQAVSPFFPLSTSVAITTMTALSRGRAHSGRFYWPAPCLGLAADARWSVTGALPSLVNTVSQMLDTLNTVGLGVLTVYSKVGTGTKQRVTGIRAGNRPDVQRRRTKQQVESYTPTTSFIN